MERSYKPFATNEQLQLFNIADSEAARRHDHQHGHHDHNEHEIPITSKWKRLVVWGNALLGAAGLAVGNTDTLSVTIDGAHNAADAATYNIQANDVLRPEQSSKKLHQRRKIAHWIIAASALGGSAKAGWDMHTGQEHTSNVWDVAVAGASVALNGLMFRRLWRGMEGKLKHASTSVRDLVKHFALIDMPSATLALSGSLVQNTSSKLEQAAAVASGVVGAVAFRPTEKNLQHNCLDHGHEGHTHSHEHTRKSKLQQASIWSGAKVMEFARWGIEKTGERRHRRMAAAIAGLGALAVGLYAYNKFGASYEPSGKQLNDLSKPEIFSGPDGISQVPAPEPSSLPNVAVLDSGSSIWDTVDQFAGNLQEHDALKDLTLEINGLTEHEATQLPVGFRVQLPTSEQIETIQATY